MKAQKLGGLFFLLAVVASGCTASRNGEHYDLSVKEVGALALDLGFTHSSTTFACGKSISIQIQTYSLDSYDLDLARLRSNLARRHPGLHFSLQDDLLRAEGVVGENDDEIVIVATRSRTPAKSKISVEVRSYERREKFKFRGPFNPRP